MTGNQEQAAIRIGLILRNIGRIEGLTVALYNIIERELGTDYVSQEFQDTLRTATREIGSDAECALGFLVDSTTVEEIHQVD